VRGEFGRSFFSREPVSQVMWQVLPNTLVLTLSALLLAYAVGVVGGALLAARRGTWAEAWGIPAVLATRAAPEFWVGMLALAVFRRRGLPERTVLLRHAARNALLPVVTAFALGIGYSIGGNVIIETVFSWPGLGRTLVRAVAAKDYPVAQAAFFLIAVVMIVMNFVADLLYSLLDPRVSHERQ